MLKKSDVPFGEGLDIAGVYKPRTMETRNTYEVLLGFVQEFIGDQPREILHGAADEVLRELKSDFSREKEKKRVVEQLVGQKMSDDRFALLVNLSRKITDFTAGGDEDERGVGGDGDEMLDETSGVPVQFDEEEEEADRGNFAHEIREEGDQSDGEDDAGVEAVYDGTLRTANGNAMDEDGADKALLPRDIDAHWIQRMLRERNYDTQEAMEKAMEILKILGEATDDR